MKYKFIVLFFLVSFLFIPLFIQSQDKEVISTGECSNIPQDIKCDKKSVNLGVGLDVLRGNSENIKISSDISARWEIMNKNFSRTEFKFTNSFLYSLSDEILNANKLNIEMLVYHYLKDSWSFFVFTRPSYNEIINLDYRLENGIGIKFDLLQHPGEGCCGKECPSDAEKTDGSGKEKICCKCLWDKITEDEISLSAAVLWDTFQYGYESEPGVKDKIKEEVWRLSVRPKISVEIMDKLRISAQVFLQPALTDTENDLRILIKSELTYDLSPELSYVLKVDGEYNSNFPSVLNIKEKWDWILTNNIRLKLNL